jgi:hypothetical protein
MAKIFESPDGGSTVYAREIGDITRSLVSYNNDFHAKMQEDKMWGEIRRLAKTNPAMKEYTDRCIELYHLLKDAK